METGSSGVGGSSTRKLKSLRMRVEDSEKRERQELKSEKKADREELDGWQTTQEK